MQTSIHSFVNLVTMLGIPERYGPRFPVVNTQDQDLLIQVVVLFVALLRLNGRTFSSCWEIWIGAKSRSYAKIAEDCLEEWGMSQDDWHRTVYMRPTCLIMIEYQKILDNVQEDQKHQVYGAKVVFQSGRQSWICRESDLRPAHQL